jgi:hypothetical protein
MRFLPRLSYANVMATIAVFIALGGASYAALKLPKNSVGTKQLKREAVTSAKISKGAKRALAGAGPIGPPGADGSALAYARVSGSGSLDSAHSKGIVAVVPACEPGDPTECAHPPDPESLVYPPSEYCFKLGFAPDVVLATPVTGTIYNHSTPLVDADIPGRAYSYLRGGCAEGYRDAAVRLTFEAPEVEPNYGFFALFN